MRLRHAITHRSGATLVEMAVVCPIVIFLLLSIITGSLGIYRFQEVAHLAREGARYASTHGGRYAEDGLPASTGVAAVNNSTDILNYLKTKAVILDSDYLSAAISWSSPSSLNPRNYPYYVDANSNPPGQSVNNYVTVTVTYQWMPEYYLVGPINLTSTSTMQMSY